MVTLEPWVWRDDWISRALLYPGRSFFLGFGAFAIVWIAVAAITRSVVLLVPIVAILLLYAAVHLATVGLHHPRLLFILDKLPALPGDGFIGRVEVASIPEREVRASLACIRWPHADDEETWWSDEQVIPRTRIRGAIPIDFCAPFGTREIPEGEDVVWRLSVQVGETGATFEVPVFPTPMPSPP
jgi:hypothetical protein